MSSASTLVQGGLQWNTDGLHVPQPPEVAAGFVAGMPQGTSS